MKHIEGSFVFYRELNEEKSMFLLCIEISIFSKLEIVLYVHICYNANHSTIII